MKDAKISLIALSEKEKLGVLRIIKSENIGIATFYRLWLLYSSVDEIIDALPDLARKGGKKSSIKVCEISAAEQELELTHKAGGRMVFFSDPEYPAHLKNIYDPPPVLIVKGNLETLNQKKIALVGARDASLNGAKFAFKIAQDLSERGIIIVSGLARGIDTAAHKGACAKGTLAIIAGGIDSVYPPENKKLYEEIIDKGAILTEYHYGIKPIAHNFPRRNRIISGISAGTVVIEATLNSGSLITANLALEQGRDVFAVPGFPLDPRSRGPNSLIKDGAYLVESIDDILNVVDFLKTSKYSICKENSDEYDNEISMNNFRHLTDDEVKGYHEQVLTLLTYEPIILEELLAANNNFDYRYIMLALLELEIAGKIQRYSGNRISLKLEGDYKL